MQLDGYAIGDLLAKSERNTVRRARRLEDGRQVVVKTSSKEYPTARDRRRLEVEHQLLEKLRSPGVIDVLGLEQQAGRVAIVLEDFGGERLPVARGAGLALPRFFPLALGIVRALGEVHARGVIHKDINPGNVLMNPTTGEVKLIDFSLATELSHEHPDAVSCTRLEGTLPYLSPEQTGRMNRDLDFRADFYSLGVTLFELLTGSLPFSAPDVLGYVHCHLSKQPPSAHEQNPAVPEGLSRVVAKLLAKNPEERYQSTRGLLDDLSRAAERWERTGEVPIFALGEHDVPERFQVSQALVGREPEVSTLLETFERASTGPASLLLVAGYSGIGKSSLVRELYKPVVEKRGNFVSGKFEQLERHAPYGALLQALGGLLKQMLTESEEQLALHRRRLEQALGSEAGVLVGLLPALQRVLGAQPPVADLPAREAQMRLQRLFFRFLGAVAQKDQPLVIFLDDLQWTDAATPQLLVHLLAEQELEHVLVLGAYRDTEVGEDHLLRVALSEIERKRPSAIDQLRLQPLSENAVEQIVGRTLHAAPERCRPLAHVLFQKAAGNPFFTSELLHRLQRQGAIHFDAGAGAWAWDDAAIAAASYADNVIELMLERLRELDAEALALIRLASCTGNEVELGLLARLVGRPAVDVAKALWPAVEARLLLPKGDDYRLLVERADDASFETEATVHYRFPHDRVMQAAYSLLDGDERARAHLTIGRLLRDAVSADNRAEHVFEFVDHLNLGRSLFVTSEEREELAELDLLAAARARRSAAYGTAVGYLDAVEALLSDAEWTALGDRRFELSRMRVECEFLQGNVERAAELCDALFEPAPNAVAKASVHGLKAQIQEQQSQLGASVATILAGLRELGLDLPEDPAQIDPKIGEGIGKLLGHLERVPIEELKDLPVLSDPREIAVTELLFKLIPPASQMNPPLFILAELILFDHALTHGTVPGSAKNFMDCGIVLGAILKDYARAYRMGKVAFAMLERQIPTPLEAAVNFVFGCFISHWGAHFQEGLDALSRGHRRGVELGDTLHASYCIVHHVKSSLFAGKELAECQSGTELALEYTAAIGAVGHAAVPRMVRRALEELGAWGASNPDQALGDADFTQEIEKTGNDHFQFVLGEIETLVHIVLGDWEAAESWNHYAEARLGVGNGSFPVPDHHLFTALILCRKLRSTPEEEREGLLNRIDEHLSTLATFANVCPQNFAHKYELCRAELARGRQAPLDEILPLYAGALAAAGNDFLHLRALAHELQAELWTDRGQPQLAQACLLESYHLYRQWGATLKLARLEQTHTVGFKSAGRTTSATHSPKDTLVTATVTTAVGGSSLDVASAIKATHAISSEVRPERLFGVLVETIIENAGAEHGYLVVANDGSDELTVAAQASVAERPRASLPVPLADFEPLAHDLVRYVARTQETVVIDDARQDPFYGSDPHVECEGVQSVLCMPIVNQGRLQAVLYAENNALSQAFTPARLNLLGVIAGQAAICIANAHLYEHLEQKVAERTRELAERNREVAAMLNSLEQGVFTIDERLEIEPRYSAHLERLLGVHQLAGRDCVDLLFAGTGLPQDALDTMRAALEFSFGSALIFAEPNRVHWVREFDRRVPPNDALRSFEVDWTPIADGDDNVCKILVAVRDVTLVKELRAQAAEHARELDIVGQLLDATLEQFRDFSAAARRALARSSELVEQGSLEEPAASEVFRHLHTLKGNARLLGFGYLTEAVHRAEELLDARQKGEEPEARRARLFDGLQAVADILAEYESVCEKKLGQVLDDDRREVRRLYEAIALEVAELRSGALDASGAAAALERLLEEADRVPLTRVVKASARGLPTHAEETGKVAPAVELDEPGLSLPVEMSRVLADALVHVFGNAVDHGLEPADERLALGKPAQGTICVSVAHADGTTTLRIRDDGRGLALAALRQREGAADASDEEVAQRVFATGVSTAKRVTTSSGRGVGLDAVKSSLRQLGGNARVVLTGPDDGGRRPFELVLELPLALPAGHGGSTERPAHATQTSDAPPRATLPSDGRASVPPPSVS